MLQSERGPMKVLSYPNFHSLRTAAAAAAVVVVAGKFVFFSFSRNDAVIADSSTPSSAASRITSHLPPHTPSSYCVLLTIYFSQNRAVFIHKCCRCVCHCHGSLTAQIVVHIGVVRSQAARESNSRLQENNS